MLHILAITAIRTLAILQLIQQLYTLLWSTIKKTST